MLDIDTALDVCVVLVWYTCIPNIWYTCIPHIWYIHWYPTSDLYMYRPTPHLKDHRVYSGALKRWREVAEWVNVVTPTCHPGCLSGGSCSPGEARTGAEGGGGEILQHHQFRLAAPPPNSLHLSQVIGVRCRWANVGLMLGQRHRRWTNINPTLFHRLVFAGYKGPSLVRFCCPIYTYMFGMYSHIDVQFTPQWKKY